MFRSKCQPHERPSHVPSGTQGLSPAIGPPRPKMASNMAQPLQLVLFRRYSSHVQFAVLDPNSAQKAYPSAHGRMLSLLAVPALVLGLGLALRRVAQAALRARYHENRSFVFENWCRGPYGGGKGRVGGLGDLGGGGLGVWGIGGLGDWGGGRGSNAFAGF